MKKPILFYVLFLMVVGFGCTQNQEQKRSVTGEVLPFPEPTSASITGKTLADSKHQWRTAENHLPPS